MQRPGGGSCGSVRNSLTEAVRPGGDLCQGL